MKMIKVYGINEKNHFEDKETGVKYRRVVGGFAWPGIKPGFFVIVAEDFEEDCSLKTRHMRILVEIEDDRVNELFRRSLESTEKYKAEDVYGDSENKPMMALLRQFNETLYKEKLPTLHLCPAPEVQEPKAFESYIHTIKNHLHPDRKTLHFGEESKIPGYLMKLSPEELMKATASDYPAIAALGYAVSYLDTYQLSEIEFHVNKNLGKSYVTK